MKSHFHTPPQENLTQKKTSTPTNSRNQKEMPELQLFPHTPKLLYLSLLFLLALFTICNADSVSGLNSLKTSEIDVIVSKGCSEKIGECFEEPEMESEISRRVLLMQKKYISYETLRRDLVPCDKPGASYYDCNARQAHPYSRGCEVITRCARSVKDINN